MRSGAAQQIAITESTDDVIVDLMNAPEADTDDIIKRIPEVRVARRKRLERAWIESRRPRLSGTWIPCSAHGSNGWRECGCCGTA